MLAILGVVLLCAVFVGTGRLRLEFELNRFHGFVNLRLLGTHSS